LFSQASGSGRKCLFFEAWLHNPPIHPQKKNVPLDDLKQMAVFACVVQHGSMSGAARALGMSPSAVSQQVRQLERKGGVTLLHRSTRKLALTEAATAGPVAADGP
jgi:molybdenum-dependent DNA-binding transcriptional regulator ModE